MSVCASCVFAHARITIPKPACEVRVCACVYMAVCTHAPTRLNEDMDKANQTRANADARKMIAAGTLMGTFT